MNIEPTKTANLSEIAGHRQRIYKVADDFHIAFGVGIIHYYIFVAGCILGPALLR